MIKEKIKLVVFLAVTLVLTTVSAQDAKNSVESVSAEQGKNIKAAQDSQAKVDDLSDKSQALRQEYRQLLQAIENSKIYNQQRRDLIEAQKKEMAQIEADVASIKDTTRKITPLMAKMKNSLTEFVKYDLPFLKEEREKRVKDLEELFVSTGVSVSEKYRKILEAYLIESEYGKTLESYKDSVEIDGTKVSADFLKVGRIGLYYLTKDGKRGGIWSLEKQDWEPLNSSQRTLVAKAVKMALKQASPALITVPVVKGAKVVAQAAPVKVNATTETSESMDVKTTDETPAEVQ